MGYKVTAAPPIQRVLSLIASTSQFTQFSHHVTVWVTVVFKSSLLELHSKSRGLPPALIFFGSCYVSPYGLVFLALFFGRLFNKVL